ITSSGWPLVSAVLGQMAHLVASITLNSASWSGSISSDNFLPSVLLWLVIIVVVVGVGVTVVVIVVVVVVVESSSIAMLKASSKVLGFEAVTFPLILLGNPPMKASMSFSVFGTMFGHKTANSWNLLMLSACIPPRQGVISQGPVFLLGLLVLAIVAACASRATATLSATSFLMAA
ncbi:hypothetical protein Tco_1513619, partial [Tanacetum coccineum]